MNRLENSLDGLLHLMDRQVVDSEGLLVCKADDLELTEAEDGLHVTALLVGAPVLVPRLGQWLGERWRRLGDAQADRLLPYRIGLEEIDRVTEEITLRGPRRHSLVRQTPEQRESCHRLGDLLGARVYGPGDQQLGRLLDVRLQPTMAEGHELRVTDLLVGRGRPGSYLGYDRREEQGPAAVRGLVRWLHRHSGIASWESVSELDWKTATIRLRTGLGTMTAAQTVPGPDLDR